MSQKRLFKGKLESAKNFAAVLDTIIFNDKNKEQLVTLVFSDIGLKLVVEQGKDFQANVYIDKIKFQEFELYEHFECVLKLKELRSLVVLTDALSVLQFSFDENEAGIREFKLQSIQGSIQLDAKLPTYHPHSLLDFQFYNSGVDEDGKLLLENTTDMRKLLAQINTKESDVVKFLFHTFASDCPSICYITINDPYLKCTTRFSTDSHDVKAVTSKGKDEISFRCKYIKWLLAAMKKSQKASFRINSEGFLCVQCDVKEIYSCSGMVEFFITSLENHESSY